MNNSIKCLDEVIIDLFKQRERLLSIDPEQDEQSKTIDSSELFTTQITTASLFPKAYEPFSNQFSMGYQKNDATRISIQQTHKMDNLLSPPDHHYLFEVTVIEPGHTDWITLEQSFKDILIRPELNINITMKLASMEACNIQIALLFQHDGSEHKTIPLDQINTRDQGQFTPISISKKIDFSQFSIPDKVDRLSPRICIFFPPNTASKYTLAYWHTLISTPVNS